jgi:hypothetical protein
VKLNQIDFIAPAVFCDFEQIEHAQETRLSRQFRSDIGKPDRGDRLDLYFSVSHTIASPFFDMGPHPNPDAAGYIPPNNSFAEALCEDDQASPFLTRAAKHRRRPVMADKNGLHLSFAHIRSASTCTLRSVGPSYCIGCLVDFEFYPEIVSQSGTAMGY